MNKSVFDLANIKCTGVYRLVTTFLNRALLFGREKILSQRHVVLPIVKDAYKNAAIPTIRMTWCNMTHDLSRCHGDKRTTRNDSHLEGTLLRSR